MQNKCVKCESVEFNQECYLCRAAQMIVENNEVSDENICLMLTEAIVKSIKERLNRRTRKTIGPRQPKPEMKGVVKKSGNNDPTVGRGDFASGTVAKEKQNQDQADDYLARTMAEQRRIIKHKYHKLDENLSDPRVVSLLNEICTTGTGYADQDVIDKVGNTIDNLADVNDGIITHKDVKFQWDQEKANGWRELIKQTKSVPSDR